MRGVKYIVVLWGTELEETLLKNINSNLQAEIHVGDFIQAFLSFVMFGGLLNNLWVLPTVLKINVAVMQWCSQRGKLPYFPGTPSSRISVSYKLAEGELYTDNSSFRSSCVSVLLAQYITLSIIPSTVYDNFCCQITCKYIVKIFSVSVYVFHQPCSHLWK